VEKRKTLPLVVLVFATAIVADAVAWWMILVAKPPRLVGLLVTSATGIAGSTLYLLVYKRMPPIIRPVVLAMGVLLMSAGLLGLASWAATLVLGLPS
jgi:hypothetical protein